MPRCDCGAYFIFVETLSGKKMPLDEKPNPEGNVRVRYDEAAGTEIAEVVGKAPPTLFDEPEERWMPHFATCPHAAKHRRAVQ